MIDADVKELATSKNFAALAVHLPSGQIMNHVMWVDATDDALLINTEVHRAKYESMQANPNVTITIWDAGNPYHYAEVRGHVLDEIRGDEAVEHINKLSHRYTGNDYGTPVQSERVIVRIAPVRQIVR